MTAELLNGEPVAARIKMELADRVQRLLASGRTPGLGTILVGDDVSSARYVEMKVEESAEIGIRSYDEHLPSSATQGQIEAIIDRFNDDPNVHSILVQLPLPEGVSEEEVLLRVKPEKDVDGLHPTNLGRLVMGAPGPLPCTPYAPATSSSQPQEKPGSSRATWSSRARPLWARVRRSSEESC